MSIIIPTYNAALTLPGCLAACFAQDCPDFEIIVVDDGSKDATAAVANAVAGVCVLRQANRGPAAARNAGARAASGDILLYTDADCVPEPDWVRHLLAALDTGGVAAGGTYACANPESRLARVIQAEISLRHDQFAEEVDFLGSFNVAYRADAFHAVGGFDERYRQASGEDNDLSYRLQDAGGRLRFTPLAVVAHFHPERLWNYLRTQARHGFWRVKLYRDHPARARGDHYAGWTDLFAPPLGLLLLFLLPGAGAALAAGFNAAIVVGAWSLGFIVYVLFHLPRTMRLRSRLTRGDLLYFTAVACARDVARGIGLIRGLLHFGLRGGRSG